MWVTAYADQAEIWHGRVGMAEYIYSRTQLLGWGVASHLDGFAAVRRCLRLLLRLMAVLLPYYVTDILIYRCKVLIIIFP